MDGLHRKQSIAMGPTDFFAKIPKIDLRRFSFRFSLEVIVAIHGKLEKFQNI
jgi:hypothetical protein